MTIAQKRVNRVDAPAHRYESGSMLDRQQVLVNCEPSFLWRDGLAKCEPFEYLRRGL